MATLLTGKVAIVTGGGSGIGEGSAKLMAERGARVIVSGRNPAPLQRVVEEIIAAGGEAIAIAADVTDEAAIENLTRQAVQRFGQVDILHANAALTDPAAMAADGLINDMDASTWDRAFQVNVRGPMLCVKHVVPHMPAGGSIIFTSSGKGTQGDLDFPAYGASKAALNMLSRYVAAQYGKLGIRSNAVVVGLVLTDTLKASFPPAVLERLEEHHLTPYLGAVRHVAEVVAFLASDAAGFVTGHEIPVDGGVTSHSALLADMRRMQSGQA